MNKIKYLKKQILTTAFISKEGHIASSFSALNMIYVIYDKILDINLKNYKDPNSNVFILSKAHASLGLYVVLVDKKFFDILKLDSFCHFNSYLSGHPNNKIPGVIANTGSLGHGFCISAGIALGKRIQNNYGNVYCLIGDQETLEGTTYETASLASNYNLNNLYVIIDHNDSSPINIDCLENKFYHFGFHVESIAGHNHYDIKNALSVKSDKPVCIVSHTIKGYGIKRMENNPNEWHHKSPSLEEYLEMIGELDNAPTII
jgi:transketolase